MFSSARRPSWRGRLGPARLLGSLLLAAAGLLTAASAVAMPRTLDNVASAEYDAPGGGRDIKVASNHVEFTLDPRPTTVRFYTDARFRILARSATLGAPLFIEVEAEICDRGAVHEQVTVWVKSELTGATESFVARETAPGSSIFRTQAGLRTESGHGGSHVHTPGTVDTVTGDTIWAVVQDCGPAVKTPLMIDPGGVLFDSANGAPIAGARVTLVDVGGVAGGGATERPAHVIGYDGHSPAPSTVTTGADGRYTFPQVQPGTYRLEVHAPEGFRWPSEAAAAALPADRRVSRPASYGGSFEVRAESPSVTMDVPADELPRALMVQLTSSRSMAEIAESVVYTATVKNAGDTTIRDVTLAGRLPQGFSYVPGTTVLEGTRSGNPRGYRGPALQFDIGTLAAGATRSVSYRAVIGPSALQGDGRHRVQARGELPAPTFSNTAQVKVEVQAGVFTDETLLLGTVFADCNANGLQDAGEPGAGGVRLFLEDGSFVTTDALGHYSFYGLAPRTHVLKVDATTLPAGAVPAATSQRHAGDGATRFVDPRPGEMHRADVALQGCSPELLQTLAERALRLRTTRELDSSLRLDLTPDGAARPLGDVRALQASGIVGRVPGAAEPAAPVIEDAATDTNVPAASVNGAAAGHDVPQAAAPQPATARRQAEADAPVELPSLESLAARLDPGLELLDVADDQIVPARLLLRVKGRAGATLGLTVDGKPVGEERIGERVRDDARGIELREYIGIALQPGVNTLTLTEHDPFGNLRASRSVRLRVPGALAALRLAVPEGTAPADGDSVLAIEVELLDRAGLRIADRQAVTLQTTAGQWDVRDLDPVEPGVQTFVEGGHARLGLRAPTLPGDAKLAAAAGPVTAAASVPFVAASRPLIAVGVIEGVLDLSRLSAKSVQPAGDDDGFERSLRRRASGTDGGNDARAAVFLKGKVRGDVLLTLSYDSDKAANQRLFRDIQPDAFYPVYGDSSVKGYDAQSTSPLYVRIERGQSYFLYGDFTTQGSDTTVRQLGAYQRSLTGARQHIETERVTANVWASHDSTRQVVVEQRGNGTSGPYGFGLGNAVVNSEKVEILVRDRNQPSLVLRTTPLTRFTDYEFEPFTGSLLLRAPLPSTDPDLNPMSLRVTAEVEQGGPKFWVAGADAQVRVNDHVEVGGSAVRDWNPLAPFEMGSVNATARLGTATTLTAEVAHTRQDSDPAITAVPGTPLAAAAAAGSGDAERIELKHDGAALKARVYAGRSDIGFANPSATLTAGRSEAGLKAGYAVDERTRWVAEALHTEDLATGSRRDGALAGIERSFDGGIKVEAGMRRVVGRSDDAVADPLAPRQDSTTVRAKVSSQLPWWPLASAFVEAEQDVRDADQRMVAVGGDYQIAGKGRIYARHELISSLTGPYALDPAQRRQSTLIGIDGEAGRNGRAFSEYRLHDGIDGREAEAAMGLRNQFALARGVRLDTSFERVQALAGASDDRASAAATGAIEYTRDPAWKGTARLELRRGGMGRSVLSTLGLAYKVDNDWTLLGKAVHAWASGQGTQPDREQQRVQLGAAYRDGTTNRVNALGRYEWKREQGLAGGVLSNDGSRTAHIVSTHGDLHPSRPLTLTGQYAAKRVDETIDGRRVVSTAQLIGARVTRDVGERWDVGLGASVLGDARLRSRQLALGGEVGYRVQQNLWASVGYNVTGFRDRDLAADNTTQRGVYVRLRFKFDERLLGGLGG